MTPILVELALAGSHRLWVASRVDKDARDVTSTPHFNTRAAFDRNPMLQNSLGVAQTLPSRPSRGHAFRTSSYVVLAALSVARLFLSVASTNINQKCKSLVPHSGSAFIGLSSRLPTENA